MEATEAAKLAEETSNDEQSPCKSALNCSVDAPPPVRSSCIAYFGSRDKQPTPDTSLSPKTTNDFKIEPIDSTHAERDVKTEKLSLNKVPKLQKAPKKRSEGKITTNGDTQQNVCTKYVQFKCDQCDKSFPNRSRLNRHRQIHSGDKRFACTTCQKLFLTKDALKCHERTHDTTKPYQCTHCSRSFAGLPNLSKHLATHSSEKNILCVTCGARFAFKWHLREHQRYHSRNTPFICDVCERGFKDPRDLSRHKKIHLDVKPITCHLCKSEFRRKDNFNRHLRNIHPEHGRKRVGKSVDIARSATNSSKTLKSSVCVGNDVTVIEKNTILNTSSSLLPSQTTSVIRSNSFAVKLEQQPQWSSESSVVAVNAPASNAVSVINGPIKSFLNSNQTKPNFSNSTSTNDDDENNDSNDSKRVPTQDCASKSAEPNPSPINESNAYCQPLTVPKIHYETCFDNGRDSIIKNIKFKLPPDYIVRLKRFKSTESTCAKEASPIVPKVESVVEPDSFEDNSKTYLKILLGSQSNYTDSGNVS